MFEIAILKRRENIWIVRYQWDLNNLKITVTVMSNSDVWNLGIPIEN